MRSKPVFALMAAAAIGLLLIARGCSGRKEDPATKVETAVTNVVDDKSQPAQFSLSAKDDEGVDFPEREEIRQMYRLTPEATVWVSNMNGKVKVETAEADIAEILVVHSARRREDLQYNQIDIHRGHGRDEKTLYIDRKSAFSSPDAIPESRQRVILRLPHKTSLEIHEIAGDITVGQIHGRVEVMRVDGAVRIARAAGQIKLGDINGGVDVAFAPLSGNEAKNKDVDLHRAIHKGPEALLPGNFVSIRSVNGDVALSFEGEVKADVNAWRVTGSIEPDLPNVERLPAEPPVGRLKARIGGGGASIEIQNVNGNLKLSKAGSKDASSAR